MDADLAALPDDIAALKAALLAERSKMQAVAAELAVARAKASEDLALIAHQKLRIAKLERQIYGPRSERSSLLIEQMALQFEELEASATEDELAAEIAVAKVTSVAGFMCAMTGPSGARHHRRRCFITPATARASTPSAIWLDIAGSSRPTLLTDIASSMRRTEVPDASSRRDVGSCQASVLRHGRSR